MSSDKSLKFTAAIAIIGINPFVAVPEKMLAAVFKQAGRDKGPIPIKGTINESAYKQTLVKYSGEWRLYINIIMLPHSPKRIGEKIVVTIAYDAEERTLPMFPQLGEKLDQHPQAKAAFSLLSPSRQQEMIRYFSHLKTTATIEKNLDRAIQFLLGKERFMGREKP